MGLLSTFDYLTWMSAASSASSKTRSEFRLHTPCDDFFLVTVAALARLYIEVLIGVRSRLLWQALLFPGLMQLRVEEDVSYELIASLLKLI